MKTNKNKIRVQYIIVRFYCSQSCFEVMSYIPLINKRKVKSELKKQGFSDVKNISFKETFTK